MLPNTNDIITNDIAWLKSISESTFETEALNTFQYQYKLNPIYKSYVDALNIRTNQISSIEEIPFLPISFFKSHTVLCGDDTPSLFFESSGTTSTINSKHYVKYPALYECSFLKTFEQFYGKPNDYIIIALLPSYLERSHSSLVFMANKLIQLSEEADSGFYLDEWERIIDIIKKNSSKKILLLGVTFALLDFAEAYLMNFSNVIVMETGGMKGRREEWTREAVHQYLKQQWQLPSIHSEYGMTELLSQAYSKGNGIFETPPFMKILVRDENDPFDIRSKGAGVLNVIDLANKYSCSFIATEDIGHIHQNGTFEVKGRLDNSALRGCSLMVI